MISELKVEITNEKSVKTYRAPSLYIKSNVDVYSRHRTVPTALACRTVQLNKKIFLYILHTFVLLLKTKKIKKKEEEAIRKRDDFFFFSFL